MAHSKWYGVNLGNWLIIETWMKKSLVEGTNARDEYSLSEAKGGEAQAFFDRHRASYITEDDFAFMKGWGINAVRIPIGYWIIEPDGPFVGGIRHLDRALDWCAKYGIDGIIDLHGAPGHQGFAHHSGRSDFFRWDKEEHYRKRSLEIIEALSQRYVGHKGLAGISLLNEPDNGVPSPMLLEYYQAGYEIVRKYHKAADVAVIAEAHQNPRMAQIHGHLKGENLATDVHYYQCFWEEHQRLELHEHIAYPLDRLVPRIRDFNHAGDQIVGEWSLAFGDKKWWEKLDDVQKRLAHQAFASSQLFAYSQTRGWFFWSYRAENAIPWSFVDSVKLGYLPASLGERVQNTLGGAAAVAPAGAAYSSPRREPWENQPDGKSPGRGDTSGAAPTGALDSDTSTTHGSRRGLLHIAPSGAEEFTPKASCTVGEIKAAL